MSNLFSIIAPSISALSGWSLYRPSTGSNNLRSINRSTAQNNTIFPEVNTLKSLEKSVITNLYKSIPVEKVEQLLSSGVDESDAIVKALSEYIDSTEVRAILPSAQTVRFVAPLDITDPTGNATVYNLQGLYNNVLDLNTGNMNDTVNLGGQDNDAIVALDTGNDVVNLDDSASSTFTIVGGAGNDILNFSGNVVDYRFKDNGNGTLTLTNSVSAATTTIDNTMENITFGDGATLTYDGAAVSVNSTVTPASIVVDKTNTVLNITMNAGNDTLDVSGTNNNVTVDMGGGNDIANIGGTSNIVNLQLGNGNDRVFVAVGSNNTVNIDGGNYRDKIILEGLSTDWTNVGSLYTHNTSGTAVIISNIEDVYFETTITDPNNTSSTYDLTAITNSSVVLNAGNMDDTISLGGTGNDVKVNLESGNNIVNIDTTNKSNFIVNGGTGTDTVNLSGSLANYTFQNNANNTFSMTNSVSGATITMNASVENINFADNSTLSYDGSQFVIKGSNSNDTLNVNGTGNTMDVSLYNGGDTVNVDGTNNTARLYLANDSDNVFVAVGDNNDISIDGAHGVDTVTLQGVAADWTLSGSDVGRYYTNKYSGTKVTLLTAVDNVNFDNAVVMYDNPGQSSNINATTYNNSTIKINAGDGDDTIDVGGTNNTVTVDLVSGNNTVNLDDSNGSTFVINAGSGTDVINLTGDVSQYTSSDDGNGLITLTNTVTGSTITYDSYVLDQINYGTAGYDITINDPLGHAGTFDLTGYHNKNILLNANDMNDIAYLAGSNNNVTANMGSGDDTIDVYDSIVGQTGNTFIIDAGAGTDTINMGGDFNEYNITDNGDGSITLTNKVHGNITKIIGPIETVSFNEASNRTLSYDGTTVTVNDGNPETNTFDLSGYTNVTAIVDTLDQVDTVLLGGSNNNITVVNNGFSDDTITIDDSQLNTFTIDNHSAFTQFVTVGGNLNDYTFQDNGTSFALTNTISGTVINSNHDTQFGFADGTSAYFDESSRYVSINGSNAADTVNMNGSSTTYYYNPNNGNDIVNVSGSNNTVEIYAGAGSNTVNLGGSGNSVIASLGDAGNTVNVDDTNINTFTINGGTGNDIVNMTGNLDDYTIMEGGGANNWVFTNNVSGAVTTIDSAETINFADGSYAQTSPWHLSVIGTAGNDTTNIGGASLTDIADVSLDEGNNTVNLVDNALVDNITTGAGSDLLNVTGDNNVIAAANLGGGNDTLTITGNANVVSNFDVGAGDDVINLGGANNDVAVSLNSGTNTVNIDYDNLNTNTFVVNGGTGIDTVNFTSDISYFTLTNNGDGTYTVGSTSNGSATTVDSNVENLVFSDHLGDTGNSFTVTDSFAASITVNTNDGNDTVNFGGSGNTATANLGTGNNIVNINDDTAIGANFTVNAGAGTYDVNVAANMSDYSVVGNPDGSTTLTNTITGTTINLYGIDHVDTADGVINVVNGTPGNDVLDATGYTNSTIIVNALAGDDTVNLGGTGNTVTVNLDSGTNTVNVDDTLSPSNTVIINGGTGIDTVNFDSDIDDYTFTNNGDGTYTISNIVSGSTTTVDSNVENLVFTDSLGNASSLDLLNISMGLNLTFNAGDAVDHFDIAGLDNANITLNAGTGDDNITVHGDNSNVTVDMGDGNDLMWMDDWINNTDAFNSTYNIDGGAGTDTFTLNGIADDWIISGNTYTSRYTGTVVNLTNVETVAYLGYGYLDYDVTINDTPGNAGNFDLTGYDTSRIVLTANDMDDTVTLGGTNNYIDVNTGAGDDIINVDDTTFSEFVVCGSTGTNDIANLSGNLGDYTITSNGIDDWFFYNNISGATTEVCIDTETTHFADGSIAQPDILEPWHLNITGNVADNTVNLAGFQTDIADVNLGDGNNTLNMLAGSDQVWVDNFTTGVGVDTLNINGDNSWTGNINLGDGNDTFNMSGSANDINTINLGTGDNIFNMSGIDNTIDTVILSSGSDTLTLNGTNNWSASVDFGAGADTLNVDGTNNWLDAVNLGDGDDNVYIAVGNANGIVVDGSIGNDTITFEGSASDWDLVGSIYTHNTSGTSVDISNIENVLFTA